MSGIDDNLIWFDRPAERWEETHPIGNGSLGGMIWGGIDTERIGLNLDTLWSGTLRDTNNYDAINYLNQARQEIFDGKYEKACHTLEEHMLGEFGENYLPMGDLRIDFCGISGDEDPVKNYRRQLDVGTATATVSFEKNGVRYAREYFCSYPDKMMVIRLSSSEKTDFSVRLESELGPGFGAEGNSILMEGRCPEHVDPSYLQSDDPIIWGERGIHFAARLSVAETDGEVRCENGEITVYGMTVCVLTLQAASGNREDPISVPKINAPDGDYSIWKERHVSDYKNLFDRVRISLGDAPDLPTDRRLEALKDGAEDPGIFALFFQYGRYLLISSSREGSEAANLQGIWNWEMRAPWSSNYTTNINVEMNYWPALACNLEECMEPYARLLSELVPNGKKTAKVHFNCRGFCVGHNTDFWRLTNPVGRQYGHEAGVPGCSQFAFFVLSGQWMSSLLWWEYEYSEDVDFLENTVYPILREAALFLCDWLIERDGYLVTCPSSSPENQFLSPDEGKPASLSAGTTIDMCIVRETFSNFLKAHAALSEAGRKTDDADLMREVQDKQGRLLPPRIGADGRLLEWMYPFEETEEGHRHISHAYGLFPGDEFRRCDALKAACKKTIDYRLAHGGGHTGWSCAWIACMFAELGDGERAYEYMRTLLTRSICPNMWTSHPPFQIDANFAGTMAMAQMLVQEQGGEVSVLPAIPKSWKSGSVSGLCLRGNKKIDIKWENGNVEYEITDKN